MWDVSFTKLPDSSVELLNLIAFFDPDDVNEKIFIDGAKEDVKRKFPFLGDEME